MENFINALSTSILSSAPSIRQLIICAAASLGSGVVISAVSTDKRSRMQTYITLLPLSVCLFTMLSVFAFGKTGAAAMAGLSLVFTALLARTDDKGEMAGFLCACASGFGMGLGFIGISSLFLVLALATSAIYKIALKKIPKNIIKRLKVAVPEGADFKDNLDGVLDRYTLSHYTERVTLKGFGEMYEITFIIEEKNEDMEKDMLDDMRVASGNIGISLERV